MGARTSIDAAALKSAFPIFVAGTAFCLAAFTSIAPVSSDRGHGLDFDMPAGSRGETLRRSRPFYLSYQYSSFADDTALYSGAYRHAEKLPGGGWEAGRIRGGTIVAGTISHHLFVRDLIAQYFIELARRVNPRTIILIGPNHHARGHSPIALSVLRWRTPFGFVEPDSEVIRKLSQTGLARVEEEAFVNEHSIGALVPFIRRTFPGTRIVPIIFKKAANRENCVKLAGVIAGLTNRPLVLASLDFSHYRTSREAEREDVASLGVLRSLSKKRIDEAFVDSRPAMLTLIALCKNIGANTVEIVQHTNSGILSHNPGVACTSYINAFFSKQGEKEEQ